MILLITIYSFQDLQLKVKWPNDIYYKDELSGSNVKIGGILVTTSIVGSQVIAAIGCGVNLSNQRPTLSINELVHRAGGNRPLSIEHFLAAFFNQLEELCNLISASQLKQVLNMYYEHWLHDGAVVTIRTESNEIASAQIVGIDEFGFLRVKCDNGATFTVHPDGNSFDMLNGLISPKLVR